MTKFLSKSPTRFLFIGPLLVALIIAVIVAGWGLHSIANSRSSTAAVGYFFLPFYCLAVAAATFANSWSVFYLIRFGMERVGVFQNKVTAIRPCAVASFILVTTALITQYQISRHKVLAAAEAGPPSALIFTQAIARHDVEVLAKLARNPNTSRADLLRIYDACKDHIMARSPREYIVLYSLSRNPKTPPDVLASLSNCHAASIRVAVGHNPSTPSEILPTLAHDKEALVRTWVTTNPNISDEILLQLADDSDRIVREYARSNLRRREARRR